MSKDYHGKWRIIEMELWDQDFIDLVVPGHFTIKAKGCGEFQFGAVHGVMDYRIEAPGDSEQLAFSWQGEDEMDPVSGRGWVKLVDNHLKGRIFYHNGDDSWFVANRMSK